MNDRNLQSDLSQRLLALLENGGEEIEKEVRALIEERDSALFVRLGQLARDMHESVKNVSAALGGGSAGPIGVPEARQRLNEALDLSERAAHQSLDVGDRLLQAVDALAARARGGGSGDSLAETVLAFTDVCRSEVRALREAQVWQDLTGQRMQQVAAFLDRVEDSVLALVQLAASLGVSPLPASASKKARASTQEQVDDLLAQFGF